MKKTIRFLIIMMISSSIYAQDIHFSQFSQAPLFVNPALTGDFNSSHRAQLNYKSQWASITTPYKTMALQYDHLMNRLSFTHNKIGLGFVALKDVAGDSGFGVTYIMGSASYIMELSNGHILAVGFQGGYAQNSMTSQNLTWDNQHDENGYDASMPSYEPDYTETVGRYELAAGLLYKAQLNRHNKAKLGLGMYHINPAKVNFNSNLRENLNRKYTAYFSFESHKKSTNLTIIPEAFYQMQGLQYEFVFGSRLRYELQQSSKYTGFIQQVLFSIGAYYRNQDALILTSGFSYRNYAFRLSYDINTSRLTNISYGRGGLELSLIFTAPYNKGKGNSLI